MFSPVGLELGDLYLIQVGRKYLECDETVPLHMHKGWFELTIVSDGEGAVTTNELEIPVKRGDIYLSFPADAHEIHSDKASKFKYDFISFYTEKEPYRSELQMLINELTSYDRVFRDERISALVCDIISEFVNEAEYSKELIASALMQILIYVIRDFKQKEHKHGTHAASEAEMLCYQLMNYIDTHIYNLESLSQLGNIMKYNYSYLSALYKKTTGETLTSYYQTKRLEVAKLLILEGTQKITEIAELLNYSSLYAFSRAFKAAYGISPKQFYIQKSI
jgi:AraC-like DNA-binding protein